MNTSSEVKDQVGHRKPASQKVAEAASTSSLVETLTRLGYMVRGLVYGTIGFLALQVATSGNGAVPDQQGAIAAWDRTPIGQVLLYVVLIGLVGYSLWGLIRAVFDPLHKGADLKGLAQRLGFLISSLSYAALIAPTYALATAGTSTAQNGSQTTQAQQATAAFLSQPGGQWVVAVGGGILAAVGIGHIVHAWQRSFGRQFKPYQLSPTQQKWIDRAGRFGTAARGVVFALIGLFLVLAAYQHDSSRAQGIDGALAALLHQPYGPWLLGVVAAGLVAFGFYSAMSGLWLQLKR